MKRTRRQIDPTRIDWPRVLRGLAIAGSLMFSLALVGSIFGIAGHMVMAGLDAAMGARLFAAQPALTWAIVGVFAGITPALWSLPTFRKRRMLVLAVPGVAILTLATLGALVPTPRTPGAAAAPAATPRPVAAPATAAR